MPAKTTEKKAPARKSTAKKPASRASAPAKNGAASSAQASAAAAAAAQASATKAREAALREQSDKHQAAAREKENQLRAAQERISALEKKIAEAAKPDPAQAQQLREVQARLTTRQAELEAARAESANLRDGIAKLKGPGESGNLRCPRCGLHMTEYDQDTVKLDRCDGCHGIFFDDGELETMMRHHDAQLLAGKKHWYSSFFGHKG